MKNKFLGTGETGYHPFRKMRVWISGLRYAVFSDVSVAYKVVASVVVLTICFYYRQWIDFVLIFAVTGLMLICEIFNTVVEALCDFIEEGHNEKIKIIKDMAAAAAGISILIWLISLVAEMSRLLGFF